MVTYSWSDPVPKHDITTMPEGSVRLREGLRWLRAEDVRMGGRHREGWSVGMVYCDENRMTGVRTWVAYSNWNGSHSSNHPTEEEAQAVLLAHARLG